MSATEWLANLSWQTVIVVIVVLVGLRFALVKQGSAAARSIAEIAESLAIAMGLVFLIIRPFFVQAFFIPSESMVPTLLVKDHLLVNKTVYLIRDPKPGDIVVFKAPPEALENNSEFANGKAPNTDFIKRCIAVPGDEVYVTPGYITIGEQKFLRGDLLRPLELISVIGGRGFKNGTLRIKSDGVYIDGERQSDEYLTSQLKATGKIEYHPGQVFVNGKAVNDSYINEDPEWYYPLLNVSNDPSLANNYPQKTLQNIVDNLNKAIHDGKLTVIKGNGPPRVKLGPKEFLMMGDNRNNSSDGRFWGPLDRNRVVGRAMFIFWPLNRIGWVR